MSVTVTPIKPEIGVEITGISGHAFVDPDIAAQCQAALDTSSVVVYRDARIDDDDLIAFSHLLGPVHIWPNNDAERRELGIVSLDPAKSKNAVVQRGTFKWHIDGTMADYPHRITLLSCLEPATDGTGDTEFANTYAAYRALSDDEKAEIDDLQVHYSYLNRAHLEETHVKPQAIAAYERYLALKPKDTDAMRALASLYGQQTAAAVERAQRANAEAQAANLQQELAPTSGFGQALTQNRISQSVADRAQAKATAAQQEAQRLARLQVGVYQDLTLIDRNDPLLFLQFAQAAETAQDYPSAVTAYRRFLALSPDDPSAQEVRQRIRLLESLSGATG